MNESNKFQELFKVNYTLQLKTFLLGAFLMQIALGMKVIAISFKNSSIKHQNGIWFSIIVILYVLLTTVIFVKNRKKIGIIIRSWRVDLFIVLVSGAITIYIIDGMWINRFQNWLISISWLKMTLILSLPLVLFVAITVRYLQVIMMKKIDSKSSFLSDKEGKSKSNDAFKFYEAAGRFAERVYNQGSTESLVFGIDAPWGTGKSTFINLCKEHWGKNYNNKIIVYTFDPLKFENSDKIMEKFVDGLLKVINDNFFAPEIESLFAKYVKLLNDSKITFSIFGLRFGMPFDKSSVDKILEKLEIILRSIDKKIVIVVDDLDRLSFSSIKDVLFVIKKSFTLPNISYVLCYDTENITALEQHKLDTEKIIEFLEKFINIKTSLYLDQRLLLNYFTDNKDETLARNLLSNPELVSKAVEGLKDIFSAKDYYLYIPFIGDARKLKRLVNTILLLEVEQLDFSNSDFDKHDLIHLLILFINYPNIFRKIYNTEAQGKRGFFSLVGEYDDDYPKDEKSHIKDIYKNSIKYNQYLANLTENQKFILNKIFNVNQRLGKKSNITQEQLTSYACFNGSNWGSAGRNLEQYLNLIINVSRPIKTEQYKFYVNIKNEILYKKSIVEVFKRDEFLFSSGEANHEQLWRVLVNSPHHEFSIEKGKEIIGYALDSLSEYSNLEIQSLSVGFRRYTLHFFIGKLLDKIGWVDESGQHFNNSEVNIIKIAEWIFGENQFINDGILEKLAKKGKGVLGIYDLLVFRLCCCTDRGGDMFNLPRSLSKHGSPNNPTEGLVKDILIGEMREISQYIFQLFNNRYIERNINIFEDVFGLSAEDICGKSIDYIKSMISDKELNEKQLGFKSEMLSFIIYQLGSTIISSGIPCGYYDRDGFKDEQSINTHLNNYLFNICFNPEICDKGYAYFIYYLFINFETTFGHTTKRIASIEGFSKVLDKDQLKTYWRKHGIAIKERQFSSDVQFIIGDFKTTFTSQLAATYNVLDEFINRESITIESN